MADSYKIRKNLIGQYTVTYRCPKCGKLLKSPILSGGTVGHCRRCRGLVIVPGQEERRLVIIRQLALKRKKEAAAAQRRGAQSAADARRGIGERGMTPGSHQAARSEPEDSRERKGASMATIPCPFCAAVIPIVAVKCRYCGEYVDGRADAPEIAHEPSRVTMKLTVAAFISLALFLVMIRTCNVADLGGLHLDERNAENLAHY